MVFRVTVQGREKLNILAAKIRGFGKEASMITRELAETVKQKAIRNFKSKPHPYSKVGSINFTRVNQLGKTQFEVVAQGGASLVERGVKPHAIPNNPFWGLRGKIHPGYKAQPWLRPAVIEEVKLFPRKANKELDDYFKV